MNKAAKLIEHVLLLRCQIGDRDAFAELIERYSRSLRYFISRLLENKEMDHNRELAAGDYLFCDWCDY